MGLSERIHKLAKGPIGLLASLLIVNQLVYPPTAAWRLSRWMREENPDKIHVPAYAYLSFSLPKEPWYAREYLVYASSLVWQYGALSGKNDDCIYFPDAMSELYQQLIALHGRKDLEEEVRFAATPRKGNGGEGHIWLEIQEAGQWIPFETLDPTDQLAPEEVQMYSEKTKKEKARLESARTETAEFVSLPGTDIFVPTLVPFFYPGGLLRVSYRAYLEKQGL